MSQNNLINTALLQQFINQVKAADLGQQKEIRLSITEAKNLSYTISLAMTRLAGNYEGLLVQKPNSDEVVNVEMDGGIWNKN